MKRNRERVVRRGILAVFCSVIAFIASARSFHPGDTIPPLYIEQENESTFFSSHPIPDSIFQRIQGKSFKSVCTVPRDSLRYLLCLHRDAEGHIIRGEIIVHNRIASPVLDILKRLYQASYPIQQIRLVDYWDADDDRSMRANNSSGFNYRMVGRTRKVSKHGRGIAIDINPLYNPYIRSDAQGKKIIEPATGAKYADRTKSFPYKIEKGDLCYRLFTQYGFRWGGDWRYSKDYQHFELPD